MPDRPAWERSLLVAVLLAVATWAVFGQAREFAFVGWDDDLYTGEDVRTREGLSPGFVTWAFTTGDAANWHPLTWISHALDFTLFGDAAGLHHLTSVLFHVANTLLLFAVLQALTGATWRSALVAALFGVHPQHAESVAWVAERKDVLSTFFGLLALGAYGAWARRGGALRYAAALALLALGLLAKPMLVTWPLLFLLLDWWPLERLSRETLRRRLLEKLPFLALAAASAVVTIAVQQGGGAVRSTELVSIWGRVANAVVVPVIYLAKTIWPSDLSLFYPHPFIPNSGSTPLAGWQIAGAAALLLAITALVLHAWRVRWLATGWAWYGVTLLPVIGLLQVGGQAMADRYTYVPLIGPFVIAAWAAGALAERLERLHPRAGIAVPAAAVGALAALGVAAHAQARTWRDSVALFEHALAVNADNRSIRFNLGNELQKQKRYDEAIAHYRKALEVAPSSVKVHVNLGLALRRNGELEAGLEHFRQAVRIQPDFFEGRVNLGMALRQKGELDEALEHLREAVRIDPAQAEAHFALADVLRDRGALDEAVASYERALALDPEHAAAHTNLGLALRSQGEIDAAIAHYREALRLEPELAAAHNNLGLALTDQGHIDEAVVHYREALRLAPGLAPVHANLGKASEALGRPGEAARHYRQALEIDPAYTEARQRLAALQARGASAQNP